jgi:hypothetical protein
MRRVARRAAAAVGLGGAILAAAASAASPAGVQRCGYVHTRYSGALAIYPWRMSCSAARTTLAMSESRHLKVITFTADGAYTFDGGAEKINGKWWVCGGRMGFYFCGYPYRPARAPGQGGGTTFKGPFVKEFVDEACQDDASLCRRQAQIFQPPRAYR